jgi:hypothetical protein
MPIYVISSLTPKNAALPPFFYARRSRSHDFQHPIKIVMEGEVEADVGVMNDAGETNYASEPHLTPQSWQKVAPSVPQFLFTPPPSFLGSDP